MTVIKSYTTPGHNQVRIAHRPNTADEPVIYASVMEDEYGIEHMGLQPGDLFLDIGAYIGSVGLAVAKDFPETRVVMVEAVPENVAVINVSIDANGWRDRVQVLHRAASNVPGVTTIPYGAGEDDESYQKDNRYVGGLSVLKPTVFLDVDNITLVEIWKEHGDVDMLKIDCEGCEYAFLDSSAITAVEHIIGEWHHGDENRVVALLDKTHHVTTVRNDGGIGIFEAKRR